MFMHLEIRYIRVKLLNLARRYDAETVNGREPIFGDFLHVRVTCELQAQAFSLD